MRTIALFLASASLAWAQDRKPISVGEPPADASPAAELATFKMLEGFEVNLFADETDAVPNPIAIRWDERGRLWVLQTTAYPQPKPGENPNDKIIILEDTNHDGRADKRTTFADGLCQPMGLELAPAASKDGHSVYVGEGEKLWLFHDDDGDDKVDRREVVLSGFGTGDTHQNINSFVWSPDGALIMHQGLHCYSKVVTPHGTVKLYGAGFWHYRPRSGKLEAYPTGMPLNPWGTAFTDDGEPIMVAGAAGMYWARPMEVSTSDTDVRASSESKGIPHFLLERFQLPYGGQSIKTEGLTKFCGVDIVGNAHWPESMQGEVVTGGFFNNKVFRFKVRPDAEFPSGVETVEQEALITSDSVAFRPIDVRFGPDGACYIADWYDPIIGHYQASFRHPNRDKAHGRIWRVTAKGRALANEKVVSKKESPHPTLAQLAERMTTTGHNQNEALQHLAAQAFGQDRWISYQAQRLLLQGPPDAVVKAVSWRLGTMDFAWPDLKKSASDEQKRAALKTINGIKAFEDRESLRIWQTSSWFDQRISDSWVTKLAAANDPSIRCSFTHSLGILADRVPNALIAVGARMNDPSPQVRLEAVVAAAKVPSPDAIKVALTVLDKPMDSYIERALWLAVHATAKHWKPLTASFLADMAPSHIAFLIQREGSADVRAAATEILKQPDLPATVREGLTLALSKPTGNNNGLAAEENRRLEQAASDPAKLQALATSSTASARLKEAAVAKLAIAAPAAAAKMVQGKLSVTSSFATMKALLAPVLAVEAATRELASLLKTSPCNADAAKLMMRVLTSGGRSDAALSAVLGGILGKNNTVPAYDPAWVNTLASEVKASGNADKGRAVFASTLTNCVACHSIAKKGGTIGPELDAVGRGVPMELLIEAVVWPNRQIKEGYIATTVTTADGRTITGYKVSDSNGQLQLRDFTVGTVHQLEAAQIKTRQDSGSLMPEGLMTLMTREELRDLMAYLASLGM